MLNCLMQRQHNSFLLAPLLKMLLVSVSANKAIAIYPRHQNFFALLRPKLLRTPPFKKRHISLRKITVSTRRHKIKLTEMWTAFALRNNVVNGQLLIPSATIRTSTLSKRSSQKIVFKNTLTKPTFCVSRAKFNERIKQLIRTIRSWHGTIQLSCPQFNVN